MKVAIYSPYLDTVGGGERYILTIAEILSADHQVNVLLDRHQRTLNIPTLKQTLEERLNLNLKKVDFIAGPFGKESKAFKRALFLKKFDLLIYLTDGSIFYSTAKKSILHIQSPLVNTQKSLKNKLKLKSWNLIIYNSNFTKEYAHAAWPIRSKVIYPPVDLSQIKPGTKKPYILSVGRFFGFLKEKKHEVLINAFRDLYQDKKASQWSLHLAGSAGDGDGSYIDHLQKLAKGLPVFFYPNLEYAKLVKLYSQSSLYWHAAGFEETDPTKMEHFGITTVEAMAGGCVPVVISQGGQVEIVEPGTEGYLWKNLTELHELTLKLIEDNKLRQKLAQRAIVKAKSFSKSHFEKVILETVANL